jgi:hypothetical protein
MKNIFLIIVLFLSTKAFSQGQFNTPTFTYNGQIYKVSNTSRSVYVKNTNHIYLDTSPMLRPPAGGEKYCTETEFPVDHQDFNLKVRALIPTLFTKQRRVALNEAIFIIVVAPSGSTQVTEVIFELNPNTKLTHEEIYKMEQAIKGINLKLYPHTCTYRYVITYTAFTPSAH